MKTRILKIIEHFEHGNKARFAKNIKARSGNVGDWLSGRTAPSANARIKICQYYPINREWLDSEKGEMIKQVSVKNCPECDRLRLKLQKCEAKIEFLKEDLIKNLWGIHSHPPDYPTLGSHDLTPTKGSRR
jgi:hypothetical protein